MNYSSHFSTTQDEYAELTAKVSSIMSIIMLT